VGREAADASKAEFTSEEWITVLEEPPSAGMVATAARGGRFRESVVMKQHMPRLASGTAGASCWTRSSVLDARSAHALSIG
jgi:hypothetical protein